MDRRNYYNILDFGSSKIRFTVFDDKLNKAYTDTKPVILEDNFINHIEVINETIKKAEKKISDHIKDILLILDTAQLSTIDLSLNKNFDSKLNINNVFENLNLELNQIIENAYPEHEIIHLILDKCIIDENVFFELPKNFSEINNIKADFKLICFPKILTNKIKKIFIEKNINIIKFFCTSYVKSLSYINDLKLENTSFLEIGFKKTSFLNYKKNKLNSIQIVPVGGDHITKDISKIFDITTDEAEKIKRSFNQTESEFSYEIEDNNRDFTVKDILRKNISVDLLKKVILYRVQEIIDLNFSQSKIKNFENNLKNSDLFFIGDGSFIFKNNSFHLNNRFEFNSLNFFDETDTKICKSALMYYLNNYNVSKKNIKKQGLFEKFFYFFSK